MEEEDTKSCDNCKRDIPSSNFTIHTVHCARNIKVCPVCKEPVPHAQLADHHDKLHKLSPCKQCGESVCGTDLEDHIRDSCGHTIKACRYCTLEVARRDLPTHESYCGARTERCPDCRELVMVKYRQIHRDSNHGFIRLDDDPVPREEQPRLVLRPLSAFGRLGSNDLAAPAPALPKVTNLDRPQTVIRYLNGVGPGPSSSAISPTNTGASTSAALPGASVIKNDFPSLSDTVHRPPAKRDNNMPQINTNVQATEKVRKDLSLSRGAVKKRPAPKPPVREPPNRDPRRDLAYQSASRRIQEEERRRQEQSERNLAAGLPPVLSAAAKLEKLRKMDALHNRETDSVDYKNKLTGRVWMPPDIPIGQRLGAEANTSEPRLFAERRKINRNPDKSCVNFTGSDNRNEAKNSHNGYSEASNSQNGTGNSRNGIRNSQNGVGISQNATEKSRNGPGNTRNETGSSWNGSGNSRNESGKSRNGDGNSQTGATNYDNSVRNSASGSSSENRSVRRVLDKNDLRDVKPMSPEQFLTRFSELTVGQDRFTDIKSQLTRLRRGLNEVTAPYNSNSTNNQREERPQQRSRSPSPVCDDGDVADGEVRLPCEFCGVLVIADDLVQHQTGCRPDLARVSPARVSPPLRPLPPVGEDPLIPCEFCASTLPVYLITEHQEQCGLLDSGAEHNLLYPD